MLVETISLEMDKCKFKNKALVSEVLHLLCFLTLVSCQNGIDTKGRPRLDCFLQSDQGMSCLLFRPVFCEFRPDNQHFIREQKRKDMCSKF